MYTTSTLWAPCKARDGHRSRIQGSGCSTRLLQHLQWYQAGPAQRGQVLGEPQCEQPDPARVTRCWPVLCCPTPSCCCSPPWGKELGMRHGWSHRSKVCTPVISSLGHRSFNRCSRGMSAPRAAPTQVLAAGAGSCCCPNTSHHPFGSWDWENKSALPSRHHPRVLEDSWTSHSVSQPV